MFGLVPWKTKAKAGGNGHALAPVGEYPPFFAKMREDMDRFFERFAANWPVIEKEYGGWKWEVDVKDEPNAVVIRAEAPGFEAGDFDIQLRGNQLVLQAFKKTTTEEKKKGYKEEEQREYYEAFTLPAEVAFDKAVAKYHNGVLLVTLPKTEAGKGKRIAVKE
jgi:HSP20 family protein